MKECGKRRNVIRVGVPNPMKVIQGKFDIRASLMTGLMSLLFAAQMQATVLADEFASVVFGKMIHRELIDCFEEGLKTEQGEVVYCGASAAVFDNTRIILASDKSIPGNDRSPVFSFNYMENGLIRGLPTYLTAAPFLNAIKYEDMTLTTDGEYVIASTGFDRVKTDTADWDGYNTMLLWPVGKPESVTVVAATTNGGITSSVRLREKISRVLPTADFPLGVPYFKVESVAVIPGQQLLLGIRETGANYRDFNYVAKIIAVPFTITEDELILSGDFELIYEFDPTAESMILQETGLSSIEYDQYHDRLYLLTSFEIDETDEGMGGYLWVLPMEGLRAGRPPVLVLKNKGSPLLFAHKPEGLAVLGDNLVLVVHDDDRVLGRNVVSNPEVWFSRRAHQAVYTLISLGSREQGSERP